MIVVTFPRPTIMCSVDDIVTGIHMVAFDDSFK